MTITYRKGTLEDSFATFRVFLKSLMDYSERMNVAILEGNDIEKLDSLWEARKPMFDFLAQDASQFWVAEKNGEILGYARTLEHNSVQELTELYVDPSQQSAGLGNELLSRAFAESGAKYRTMIATFDQRALYRYLKIGVRERFILKYFSRRAEKVALQTDLQIESLNLNLHLADINHIDKKLLAHKRDTIHEWLASQYDGFIYKRKGEIVGYGYIGDGPFAVLDENDFPAVLAHAESFVAEKGGEFAVSVPLINNKAIEYFIQRKYQIDSFSAIFMSNKPFGKFENYLSFATQFFL